jgi:hypothetical protein
MAEPLAESNDLPGGASCLLDWTYKSEQLDGRDDIIYVGEEVVCLDINHCKVDHRDHVTKSSKHLQEMHHLNPSNVQFRGHEKSPAPTIASWYRGLAGVGRPYRIENEINQQHIALVQKRQAIYSCGRLNAKRAEERLSE